MRLTQTLIFVGAMALATIANGQEREQQNVNPAALQFTKAHPITNGELLFWAQSYLIINHGLQKKVAGTKSIDLERAAAEFRGLVAGMFISKSADEVLSCLSWQSLDEVVDHVAIYIVKDQTKTENPMINAGVPLAFACMTPDQIEKINQRERQENH